MGSGVGAAVGGVEQDDGAGLGLLGRGGDGQEGREDDEGEARGDWLEGWSQGNEWLRG